MKAVVLREYETPLQIAEVELADPKPGEVLIKLAAVGVCHSDLHVITGDLPVPIVLLIVF
jgi:S-(hydroxymethyl)glutathione dehydrogenase/alcohol dehydrogenase